MNYLQEIATLSTRYQELLQQEATSQQALVESYRAALSQLVTRYDRLPPTVELPLTIPQIFRRGGDENFISDYLAYLLNPQINGIGVAPLEKLLELCHVDAFDLPWDALEIRREYGLEAGRIDFLLQWGDALVVGIENKIYSSEHDRQTMRYEKNISEKFSGIPTCLVYLARDASQPASKKFLPLSYAQLVDAFRTIPVSPEIGLRKYLLWQDFLEHLEVYLIMSDPEKFEFSEKARLYIEHHAMINDLSDAYKADYGNVVVWLESRLLEHLDDDSSWKTRFNRTNYSWQQILKSTWENNPRIPRRRIGQGETFEKKPHF